MIEKPATLFALKPYSPEHGPNVRICKENHLLFTFFPGNKWLPSELEILTCLDLLRAVSKFVETVHWKEALKILKLAVTRSSTLVAPPSSSSSLSTHSSSHLWEAHTSFAEAEVYFKKGKKDDNSFFFTDCKVFTD